MPDKYLCVKVRTVVRVLKFIGVALFIGEPWPMFNLLIKVTILQHTFNSTKTLQLTTENTFFSSTFYKNHKICIGKPKVQLIKDLFCNKSKTISLKK